MAVTIRVSPHSSNPAADILTEASEVNTMLGTTLPWQFRQFYDSISGFWQLQAKAIYPVWNANAGAQLTPELFHIICEGHAFGSINQRPAPFPTGLSSGWVAQGGPIYIDQSESTPPHFSK